MIFIKNIKFRWTLSIQKMMRKLFELIEKDYFPKNSKILAFHTGGLQGVFGANDVLRKQNKTLINIEFNYEKIWFASLLGLFSTINAQEWEDRRSVYTKLC